jgi:hypothetical protein
MEKYTEGFKKSLKDEVCRKIDKGTYITGKERLKTICRSKLNRPSFDLVCGDKSIYLKGTKSTIFVENRPSVIRGDGYGGVAFKTAYREAAKILEVIEDGIKETVCSS